MPLKLLLLCNIAQPVATWTTVNVASNMTSVRQYKLLYTSERYYNIVTMWEDFKKQREMKVLLLAYIDRKRMIDLFFLSEMTHRLNKLRLYWLNFGLKNYLTNQKSNRFSFLFNYHLLRSAKNNNRMPLDSYSWILIFAYVLICTQVFFTKWRFCFSSFFCFLLIHNMKFFESFTADTSVRFIVEFTVLCRNSKRCNRVSS